MADEETGEYHVADAGASKTFPMQCGALKKGGSVLNKICLGLFPSLSFQLRLHQGASLQDCGLQHIQDWEAWSREGSHCGH